MATTYREIKRFIQPLYQKYRGTFRGPRSSEKENLEMNKILIDLKRLDNEIENIDQGIYEKTRIIVGGKDPAELTIHEEYEDGKYYIFSDVIVDFYSDSATPDYITLDSLPTALSKLSRLNLKIKRLENKKA